SAVPERTFPKTHKCSTYMVTPSLRRAEFRKKPQRFHGDSIRRVRTFFWTVDYAEAAATIASAEVPHVPADAVVLERAAHVMTPAGAVLRIGDLAVHTELVAGERHIPALGPFGSLADFDGDAVRVPVVEAVAKDLQAVIGVRLLRGHLLRAFKSGGIGE